MACVVLFDNLDFALLSAETGDVDDVGNPVVAVAGKLLAGYLVSGDLFDAGVRSSRTVEVASDC